LAFNRRLRSRDEENLVKLDGKHDSKGESEAILYMVPSVRIDSNLLDFVECYVTKMIISKILFHVEV